MRSPATQAAANRSLAGARSLAVEEGRFGARTLDSHDLIRFLVHRALSAIPVLFGIVALVFVMARVIPGDPCRAALGERATAATCDAFAERYGLDQPIFRQFLTYLGDLFTGDLGNSFSQRRSDLTCPTVAGS